MNNCINYNCTELPDHQDPSCGGNLLGGIDAMVVFECGHTVDDMTDADQISDNITAGKAKVVNSIRVGIDLPSPIEVDPVVACQPAKTINYDRTGTIIDGTVNFVNICFWDELFDGRQVGGLLLRLCGSGQVFYINAAVSFQGGTEVPNDNTDLVKINGTFKWKDIKQPKLLDEPIGIFS